MNHARKKLVASALAAVLAPASALAVAVAPTTVLAADVQEAKCQAFAVHLSKTGDGVIPKELRFLEAQLSADEFAIYKGYALVDQKTLNLKRDKASEVKFSSGNRLGLSLLGNDDKRLKLHASLSSRDGSKNLLNADYSIEDGGTLMIGAGAYSHGGKDGKLFFAIRCARSG